MTSTIYRLNHYHPLSIAQPVDRVSFDGKTIGNFSTPGHAARAHAAVAGQEGFRDWPDGFRLLEIPLDHDFFVEGFILHTEGDIAIAGDSSGDVGNDTEMEKYGSVPPEYPEEPLLGDPDLAIGQAPGGLWELTHFKIGPRSEQCYFELGAKMIGLYTNAENAKATISRLRDKPGFNQWPGGWRIFSTGIDHTGWEDGFVNGDED